MARDHCNHVVDSFVVGRWCSRNSRHQNSFINPILLVALTENIDGATNIFAGDFVNMYIFIGGAGSTLGLVLLMLFRAKSQQLKVLGKAAILPGLFNINEPVIFWCANRL